MHGSQKVFSTKQKDFKRYVTNKEFESMTQPLITSIFPIQCGGDISNHEFCSDQIS